MQDTKEPKEMEREELISSEHRSGAMESREEIRISQEPNRESPGVSESPMGVEHRERFVRDAAAERRLMLGKVSQMVWLLVAIIDGLIGLRVLLKLLAANPGSPFARFIYDFSALFLWPFAGLTANPSSGDMILEVSSIIGLLFYALLGWLIVRLIWAVFEDTSARSISRFDRFHRA
jgi:hypothetical protein